jgi:enamine deaminase RidA (YjgF/YER057c/UK114 family)
MSEIEKRLAKMGIVLPAPLVLPSNNRTRAVQSGNLLYVSGHGAALLDDSDIVKRGKVGIEVSEEDAYRTARACAIKMLATVKYYIGGLDRVTRIVQIHGLINAHPDFERHNMVLNGASDFFYEVFGEEVGCHSRYAMGVGGLVARQPIEIDGIFEISAE